MAGLFSSWKDKKGSNDGAVSAEDIVAALARVRAVFPATELTPSQRISERTGHEVLLKWENLLRTGSFKERGAVNVLTLLNEKQRRAGVCAASLGNHALALSYHAARFAVPCTIVMPTSAPLIKVQSTKNTGARTILHGQTFVEAYQYAQQLAEQEGLRFVSAFDDPEVIAGQGTCGLEILEQCNDFDSLIVPMGGGGLISGIALAVKSRRPEVFILGVQSDWVTKGLKAGDGQPQQLIPAVSIADGLAVKSPGKLTAPLVEKLVDKRISVSESQIAEGIIAFLELERSVVEGAGAVGLPALFGRHLPSSCKKTVVVISGSNIDMNMLSRLIERDMGERGRLLRIVVSVPDRPGSLHTVTGIVARGGANVLEVLHDRSFSHIPGNVDISMVLEVKDPEHKAQVLRSLTSVGIEVRELV